MHNKERGKI